MTTAGQSGSGPPEATAGGRDDWRTAPGVSEDTVPIVVGGEPAPGSLGVVRGGAGARLAIHAAAPRGVRAELFELAAARPFRTVELELEEAALEPFRLWTAELGDLPEAFEYTVRAGDGPPLVDPYARQLAGGEVWGRSDGVIAPGIGRRYRALVLDRPFDWQGVGRPRVRAAERVVYELHVRGFTRHPSAGVARPGSFLGVVERIPRLLELGVTSVELLPVFEFDETENPRLDPVDGGRLWNFWGYSPVSFFAPKAAYASRSERGLAALELKEMVRELHRAGLEVILDVVYNHTAEGAGGATDPLHSLRGLDAGAYYLHGAAREALDFTGCGNTVNVQHPVTRRLILDSLRHWAGEYRIDGFRFDLAAVFHRGERGQILERPPLVDEITGLPELEGRLLVAEPWDARGFSPRGGFPAPWLEWDGEFRDTVRRFVGGMERDPRPVARRLAGLGPQGGRLGVERALRFVACHDGRPLADVVAYSEKHNFENGENDQDGWDGEVAWNGGVEGPTHDPALLRRREREVRLLAALLLAAPGAVQITAGDEILRTQRGNNNAWCHDDELAWIDWRADATGQRFAEFLRGVLRLRREQLVSPSPRRTALFEPFVDAPSAEPRPSFLLLAADEKLEPCWFLAVNASPRAVRFPVPAAPLGRRWRLRLDSGRPLGQEIFDAAAAPFLAFETAHLAVQPRSIRLLTAEALPLQASGG